MSIGNDRYEERGAMTCADCDTYPKSEYELGDWHGCDCDPDAIRCEGCASTHECIPCEVCGVVEPEGVCATLEAARADAH